MVFVQEGKLLVLPLASSLPPADSVAGGPSTGPSVNGCNQSGQDSPPVFAGVDYDVRGLYIATGQYSSLCVSAVVLTLGGDDIVEVVPDREQADSDREKVEEGEKQERETNTKRQQTLKHITSWMACGWSEMHMRHFEPRCECDHMCNVYEKNHV